MQLKLVIIKIWGFGMQKKNECHTNKRL